MLSKTAVQPGGAFTASGTGFASGEVVDISLGSTALVPATASSAGTFKVKETVSLATLPGSYTVHAVGRRSGRSANRALAVRVNWPQFGFSGPHANANLLENAISTSNVASLMTLWSVSGADFNDHSSPVDADGMVFEACDFSVCAYKQGSGALVWKSVKHEVNGMAAVADNLIITTEPTCGTGTKDCQHLRAYSEATGAAAWSRLIPSSHDFTPLIAGSTLYVSTDTTLYALKASTGATIWSRTGAFTSAPAYDAGTLVVGGGNGLEARSASTGAIIWNVASPSYVTSPPLIAQGLVFTDSPLNTMSAVSETTGASAWSLSDYGIDGPFAYDGTSLFAPTDGGGLVSLVPTTGQLQWSATPTADVTASPAVANGVVYYAAGATITAADASTGAILWTSPALNSTIVGTLMVTNGRLYAATDRGAVHAWGL